MGIIRRDVYKRRDWNAICDITGQKYKASDMRMQWDGTWAGRDQWSPKHPQLEIKPRPDYPARTPVRSAEPKTEPFPGFIVGAKVLDASLKPYFVSNIVHDADGVKYQVGNYVMDADGVNYLIFQRMMVNAPDNPNTYYIPPTIDQGQML